MTKFSKISPTLMPGLLLAVGDGRPFAPCLAHLAFCPASALGRCWWKVTTRLDHVSNPAFYAYAWDDNKSPARLHTLAIPRRRTSRGRKIWVFFVEEDWIFTLFHWITDLSRNSFRLRLVLTQSLPAMTVNVSRRTVPLKATRKGRYAESRVWTWHPPEF